MSFLTHNQEVSFVLLKRIIMSFGPGNEFLIRIKVNESQLPHANQAKREAYKRLLKKGEKNHFDFEDYHLPETTLLKMRERYIRSLRNSSLKINLATIAIFGLLFFLSAKIFGF